MNRTILILSIALASPAMAQTWRVPGDLTQITKPPATTEKVPDFNGSNTPSTHPSSSKPTSRQSPQPDPENRNSTDEPTYPAYPTPIDHPASKQMADACFEAIRPSFFDPYSAKMDSFKILQMPDSGIAALVMLNGKNRFGAYVGSKPYHCRKLPSGKWTVGEGIPDTY